MKSRYLFWLLVLVLVSGLFLFTSACTTDSDDDSDEDDTDDDSGDDDSGDDDDLSDEPMTSLNCQISINPADSPDIQASLLCADQELRGLTPGQAKVKIYEKNATTKGWELVVIITFETENNIHVGTTMDLSGSMDYLLDDLKKGVKTFYDLYTDGDTGEIVKFSSAFEVVQPFTGNKQDLLDAIEAQWPEQGGNTALYDSMLVTANDTKWQDDPKAVIAFTDGGENFSKLIKSFTHLKSYLVSLGFPVFTIGLNGSDFSTQTEQELIEIAEATGGFYYFTPNSAELTLLYLRLAGILRAGVQISWQSDHATPGDKVDIKVEVEIVNQDGTFTDEDETSYTIPETPTDDDDDAVECDDVANAVVDGCGVIFEDKNETPITESLFVDYCEDVTEVLEIIGISSFFECMYSCAIDYCDLECMIANCLFPPPPGDAGCGDTASELYACHYRWTLSGTDWVFPPLDFVETCEDRTWLDWDCTQDCVDDFCPDDPAGVDACLDDCY